MTIATATLLILKVLIIIGLLVYSVFAAVIYRQEQLMANVLEESFEPVLRILTIVHLIVSLGLLALSFVLL